MIITCASYAADLFSDTSNVEKLLNFDDLFEPLDGASNNVTAAT